ncbi:MAG: hypothetical protein ABDI20_03455 [Candidatus Bipolaricaulaceae bacterium]
MRFGLLILLGFLGSLACGLVPLALAGGGRPVLPASTSADAPLAFTALALSADGQYLAAGTYEGNVLIWSQELVASYDSRGTVLGLAFSPDGKYLYSVSASGEVYCFDLVTKQKLLLFEAFSYPRIVTPVESVPERVRLQIPAGQVIAAFSAQADLVAIGAQDGVVRVWDLATAQFLGQLALEGLVHWKNLTCLAFNPRERHLLALCFEGNVWLWDVKTHRARKLLLDLPAAAAAFAPDGRRLLLATRGGDLGLVDLEKEEASFVLSMGEAVVGIQFVSDGEHVVIATPETIAVVSLAARRVAHAWTGSAPLALSADGKSLAHASLDRRSILLKPVSLD